jgi:hypothetical protein
MCNIVYFMLTCSPSYMSALAFYSKPLHNRFIVTKEEVWIQLTSQWSCMCVLGVYMFAFFLQFLYFNFGNVPTVWYFFSSFHCPLSHF